MHADSHVPGDPRTQGKFWFGPDHGALVRRGCWFGLSRPQVGRAELSLGLLRFVFGLCSVCVRVIQNARCARGTKYKNARCARDAY